MLCCALSYLLVSDLGHCINEHYHSFMCFCSLFYAVSAAKERGPSFHYVEVLVKRLSLFVETHGDIIVLLPAI